MHVVIIFDVVINSPSLGNVPEEPWQKMIFALSTDVVGSWRLRRQKTTK